MPTAFLVCFCLLVFGKYDLYRDKPPQATFPLLRIWAELVHFVFCFLCWECTWILLCNSNAVPASIFIFTSLKNLLKIVVLTNCNLNASNRSGHEKLYPGNQDAGQAIINDAWQFSKAEYMIFSRVINVIFPQCKVQFVHWFVDCFFYHPHVIPEKVFSASFCNFLKSSSSTVTWASYHFIQRKGGQSRYHITKSTYLPICSHRSSNRFWTWMYSLKCQNPLHPL